MKDKRQKIKKMVPILIMIGLLGMIYLMNKKSAPAIQIPRDAFLVDVRTETEFKGGSVEGAVNIPYKYLTKELDKFEGKKSIVVFCRTGHRSGKAKEILEEKGFTNVLNGGSWGNVNKSLGE